MKYILVAFLRIYLRRRNIKATVNEFNIVNEK